MILYIENLKDSTKKQQQQQNLSELINEFSKVAGYKSNIQKLVANFYTNNELSERDIKKTIPLVVMSKKKKKKPGNKCNQRGKRLVLRKL